jgi:integrase
MTEYVFKPSRKKNGKTLASRLYSGRYRLPGQAKVITVALHVSDQQAAKEKLREIVRDLEREEMGIGVPKRIRDAASRAIGEHIKAYCADLRARKCDVEYVDTTERRLMKLATECNWRRLTDVSAESFQKWRGNQTLAAKTLNDYLAAMSAFFSWLERTEVVERNPLKRVGKVEGRGNERRKRRAFTPEELQAVITIAGRYRLAFLTAYYSALRRNELTQLEWADIQETGDSTFIVTRASTTKNRKAQRLYIPRWFADELMKSKPKDASGNTRVFPSGAIPSMWMFKRLLTRAGVVYKDDQGRQADFHALRRSVNTHMANAGVDPQTRKEIMRHSALSLTLDVYTDKGMLPLAEAVEKLPVFLKQLGDAHPCAHNPDFSGHALSSEDAEKSGDAVSQIIQDEERRRALALTDTTEQNCEKSCLARTRT